MFCQFVTRFIFTILSRSHDRQSLPEWCGLLCRMLSRAGLSTQCWFARLLTSHALLREIFLECPLRDVRNAFLTIAVQILRWTYEREAHLLETFVENAITGQPRYGQQWEELPVDPGNCIKQVGGQPPLLVLIWATLMELIPVAQH